MPWVLRCDEESVNNPQAHVGIFHAWVSQFHSPKSNNSSFWVLWRRDSTILSIWHQKAQNQKFENFSALWKRPGWHRLTQCKRKLSRHSFQLTNKAIRWLRETVPSDNLCLGASGLPRSCWHAFQLHDLVQFLSNLLGQGERGVSVAAQQGKVSAKGLENKKA